MMPLDFGTGPTYTELLAVRGSVYAEKSPRLIGLVDATLNLLEHETVDATPFLSTLNNLSMDLARLNTIWCDFSVVCASAFLASGDVGADTLYRRVKVSFETTKAKILLQAPT
jgi:hypothetical protein